ncbi:MAG: SIMPL domain-containing protein [Clostridia bacterium]|nr:SIMPL domain-containing protein [Clostridia bacterium]
MKKGYIIGSVIAVAFIIGVIFGPIMNMNAQVSASETESMRSIVVSGEYSVEVAPNVAYLTMAVETSAKTAEAAQKSNAEKMDNVYKKLKALGIDEKQITTNNYNIYPDYDWIENQGQVLKGYNVSNQIKVETSDLDKVSSILDVAVKEGINRVTSVSFGVTDSVQKTEYQKALKEAVKNAEEKAKAIASVHGTKLDKPFKVSEVSNISIARNYMSYNLKEDMAATPINPDDVKISATVEVIYQY